MIPYGKQEITSEDIESVVNVLKSDFLTQGPAVPLFEQKLCDYTGVDHAVVTNSATSALYLAYKALGLKEGDYLWTSPISFVATSNTALQCNAKIDFVDVEQDTGLLCVDSLRNKLELAKTENKLPKIVVPVHLTGQSCDMKGIYELSQEFGFKIVEDAAHAIGAKYNDKPVGSCEFSDITVFSFHPVKIITTGEGGAVLTKNKELAIKVSMLRSHGITRDADKLHFPSDGGWYYEQLDLGGNYRLTDIQAALGLSQLQRIDNFVLKRHEIANVYDRSWGEMISLNHKKYGCSSYHLYVLQMNNAEERSGLYDFLQQKDIDVNVHYIPIYKQPYYQKFVDSESKCYNAEQYYLKALTLPIFPGLKNEEQEFVIEQVKSYLEL
jgi:UDP-4-amino-4,6-dideoxy-N-acetyl-beta-L-altrosamine transaminase